MSLLEPLITAQSAKGDVVTLFSWGYWGWGTSTRQLLEAVDAVELSRGYQPPLFVDIRLSRSVRATGFNGSAFEKLVGSSRYRWIDDLGNLGIKDGGATRLKNPHAVETLLELALTCGQAKQRIIFFCSCEFPRTGVQECHRMLVANLLLERAGARNQMIEIGEWPGGELREELELELPRALYAKLLKGGSAIPLAEPVRLADYASLPWLLPAAVYDADAEEPPLLVLTGPARYKNSAWTLPLLEDIPPDITDDRIASYAEEMRRKYGFAPRRVP